LYFANIVSTIELLPDSSGDASIADEAKKAIEKRLKEEQEAKAVIGKVEFKS